MLVVPGDAVPASTVYGPGVEDARALVAGEVVERGKTVFIENNFRRYTPAARDYVIGVIQQRGGEFYRVSLQSQSRPVRLNLLAFENATRKNKPNLQPGDVVYARVSSAPRDLEAEIECFDPKTKKAAGFGQLKDGTLISVGLGFARQLLFEGHPVLEELGAKYSYQLAIGVNGRVWVSGPDAKTTLLISQRIADAEPKYQPTQ